ncbi:MAG: sulfatase-like hydrolase/transferase [Eubacterium sp.]|nr:sulfatase-like hydrolase/transferase [Eubacterium sp.]
MKSMKNILNNNLKTIVFFFFAIILGFLLIFLLDYDLLKTIYEMYYGNSEITQFFKEQGENIFEIESKSAAFSFIIYRAFYSSLPIIICIFTEFYYHTVMLPEKMLKTKLFTNNPSLGKILTLCRYIFGIGLAVIPLFYNRTFFNSVFHNCLIGNKVDFVRIGISTILFLIPTIEWRDFCNDIYRFPRRHKKLTCFFFILFISVISYMLVELQIGSKMNVLEYLIHINIMYWVILQLVFLGIFRTPKFGAIISLMFSYLIGLANDIVYQFRGNYIMFGDLTVIRTALEVAGNYSYKLGIWFWISVFIFLISILFVILVKIPKDAFKSKSKIGRVLSTVIFEGLIVLFVFITFKTGDFYGKVFGVGWDYNENVSVVGYLPYFFSNMDSTTRLVVEGYSAENVKIFFEESESHESVNDNEIEPNIILIQNEAFSDLSIMADIETDVDPMPFIHGLSDNTEKGYLNMSVTGGPTSNTEFEVLSRSSLQFFPYGSVPYTQYLKQNIPSLVVALENQKNPYNTVAYHSYYSSGYNRNSVYDYLGFDKKLFENNFMSDYPQEDLPRGYLSDEANYRRVINEFEENQETNNPFFCFNVTIQGHGGYGGGPFDLSENVKVTNFDATDSINTYLSSVKMSDTAFKGLVEYFEQIDEPTIIMMYGDHQPSFDDDAKELLQQHPAWDDKLLQNVSHYYVPYVIWANFDIDEVDNLKKWGEKTSDYIKNDGYRKMNTLSTNYLGTYLMKKAGLELSKYDIFLYKLHDKVPAVTAIGVWDEKGQYYANAISSPDSDELKKLEMIQYNLIFDDMEKVTEDFVP